MQWGTGPGVGFTTGTPWEAPQADGPAVTVAAQEGDSGSLLNLYRRLIHLRAANEALGTGRLVALTASSPSVVAYLRRAGDHTVLVVANLGDTQVSGVALASAEGALPPGRYALRNLLGGPDGAPLEVAPVGQLRDYSPVPGPMGRHQVLVLDLVRR